MPPPEPADRLTLVLAALADPTRRGILERLTRGEATVTELAEPYDVTLPAISRHLKVLENAGLITRGREAQRRPCRLNPEPLRALDEWMDPYRRLYEESFDRLDTYLREAQQDDQGEEP